MRAITPEPNLWSDGERSYKLGDDDWPVVSLQINLNLFGNSLVTDGVFGPRTEKVVKAFQSHRHLLADGIAGQLTQERICISLSQPAASQYQLPAGLLRGLIQTESSFYLSAYTPHPSGEGFDLGAFQDAYFPTGSQAQFADSLNVDTMAFRTAKEIRDRHTRYRGQGTVDRLAWEAAALGHNNPLAGDRIAAGRDPSTDADAPAAWVEKASGGLLHTPREWFAAYVANVTRYVNWP